MLNAFTVDVEDYFQVSAFERHITRADWEQYECRVERSTEVILRLLEKYHVVGTFFILGWVAERYPQLIKRIQQHGHELASHGYWHRLIYDQTPEQFAEDLRRSVESIGNASGERVTTYRAPSFSITSRSLWALDVLSEQGFTVDSSIFPISGHDRYGIPGAQREIHALSTKGGSIVEFPPSAWHVGKFNLPIGGGYFRILPLALTVKAMRVVEALRPTMFYIHPWEFDPGQPRIEGLSRKTRFRHYTGLSRTESRMAQLLERFKFGPIRDILASLPAAQLTPKTDSPGVVV